MVTTQKINSKTNKHSFLISNSTLSSQIFININSSSTEKNKINKSKKKERDREREREREIT
jgi:hypothetical protein